MATTLIFLADKIFPSLKKKNLIGKSSHFKSEAVYFRIFLTLQASNKLEGLVERELATSSGGSPPPKKKTFLPAQV